MAVLNLRNVPDEVMRRLKSDAALAGRGNHFHEHCIGLLERGLAVSLHSAEWRRQMGIGTVEASGESSTLQNRAQNIPEIIPDAPADEPLETRIT